MKKSMFLICLIALLSTVTVDAQSSWNWTVFSEITNSTGVLFKNAAEKKETQAALIETQLEQMQKRIDQIKGKIESLGVPKA